MRVMKVRDAKALAGQDEPASTYEVVKVLGKGSFGVVRLVREKHDEHVPQSSQKKVYAMKVIRKADMLQNSQEGHLRAERDFLVAAEGSKWIVPLVASFQDLKNLYLVMEYMPGGDFLGLLIRENILPELVTRWYIAEMILCIEEAHTLRWIHRDIKPDNFLISASGHLKISDFGLAFDGSWFHDQSYYNNSRYSLLEKLGIKIEGDTLDRKEANKIAAASQVVDAILRNRERQKMEYPVFTNGESILDWRNRRCNRDLARSVVGTSQYMAPEVIRGEVYDGRCDWWSLGVILFECLYGHTPFLSDDGGRHQTKMNIIQHQDTFYFPSKPYVSRRCQDLIGSLIKEKDQRLCSKRYKKIEYVGVNHNQDYAGHHVYPNDAEDIKSHKWFRGLPWERLHLTVPPFVPDVKSTEDTRYFDEEQASDFSDSISSSTPEAGMLAALKPFDEDIQAKALDLIAQPHSALMQKKAERDIDALDICDEQKFYLKAFVSHYSLKEKKRPRDKLLRDRRVGNKVMEVRKQNAFLGYTYRVNRASKDRLTGGRAQVCCKNSLGRRRIWHRARLSMQ
ncbi:kinase-like domain-containing protein [Xylogone sp. PMI_703]|nr:kinase-like domain-containing protein [Xylogone sp. PMI_703]